jgi:hypothetical protein
MKYLKGEMGQVTCTEPDTVSQYIWAIFKLNIIFVVVVHFGIS